MPVWLDVVPATVQVFENLSMGEWVHGRMAAFFEAKVQETAAASMEKRVP